MSWINKRTEPDWAVLEESTLARAQSFIQQAICDARISRSELARKMSCPRSFVTRMMGGSHNLTVRTMTRALLACGYEIEFTRKPATSNWISHTSPTVTTQEPTSVGTLLWANLIALRSVPTEIGRLA